MPKKKQERIETCGICLRGIDLDREDYVHLEDYHKGKFFIEGYYHTKCYNDRVKGKEEMVRMKKMAFGLLKNAQKQMSKLTGEPEEVYEVR